MRTTSMAIDTMRQTLLQKLNLEYIYGRLPLLHLVVLLTEMAMVIRLINKFDYYYAEHPVLTIMVTNAILNGIADSVAQSITSIRLAASRRFTDGAGNDDTVMEFRDLDRKNSLPQHELVFQSRPQKLQFDFERLIRFIAYGFIMAPAQFKWFQFLSKAFPISKESALGSALKMMTLDQLIFAPVAFHEGIATFFTVMTIAEGGGRRAVSNKMKEMYLPTLKANYLVWPVVQMINFRLIPVRFQLPFVSTVGIAWTAYLSLSNATEDFEVRSVPQSPNIR